MIRKRILVVVAVFIVLQCSLSFALQRRLIFHEKKLPATFQYQSDYPFKEYTFSRRTEAGDSISLSALYFSPEKEVRGTVFYLHGTLGNLQTQEHWLHDFLDRGYAVFIYDYRSYGKSTGVIHSENDLHEDAAWMYEQCKQLTGTSDADMTVVGRSLGTGMAVPLAAKYSPNKLILITPYFELADVAKRFMPYMPRPAIQKVLKFNLSSEQQITAVTCPVYVFHGTMDILIPFNSAKKFEPYISDNGQFIPLKGARHMNITYFTAFQQHLDAILNN